MEITSRENPRYKELKKIAREKSEYVFIEGKKLFQEAVNSQLEIEKIYLDKKNQSIIVDLQLTNQPEVFFIDNELLSSAFTTESKPEDKELIIALAKRPTWQLADLFKTEKNIVFLERIQDPGNLGAIIRSSLAFTAGGIVLSASSVDPFNTKVIRASAGAVFNMPIVTIDNYNNFASLAIKEKYNIIATSPKAKKSLKESDFTSKTVFLFGSEGSGLSKELLNTANGIITIPHSIDVESLNLGIAVSIILWEIYSRGLPRQTSTGDA